MCTQQSHTHPHEPRTHRRSHVCAVCLDFPHRCVSAGQAAREGIQVHFPASSCLSRNPGHLRPLPTPGGASGWQHVRAATSWTADRQGSPEPGTGEAACQALRCCRDGFPLSTWCTENKPNAPKMHKSTHGTRDGSQARANTTWATFPGLSKTPPSHRSGGSQAHAHKDGSRLRPGWARGLLARSRQTQWHDSLWARKPAPGWSQQTGSGCPRDTGHQLPQN